MATKFSVADIAPELRAARQGLTPSQRGALNRGISRHVNRGASVDEVKAFIRDFAADPSARAKDFPEPPPLDPRNHQIKPDPQLEEHRRLLKVQKQAFRDRMALREREEREANERYFRELQAKRRKTAKPKRRRRAPSASDFKARS